ncbi:MAG TPA: tetratricopeptide repeat protein [Rectinemataceae bacterium]|nr:tetratricopeptide repeat protein [Rectinemataceae bacterium]
MAASSQRILAATALVLSALAAYELWSIAAMRRDLRKAVDGLGAELGALDERRSADAAELASRLEADLGRLDSRSSEAARAEYSSLGALERRLRRSLPALESEVEALKRLFEAGIPVAETRAAEPPTGNAPRPAAPTAEEGTVGGGLGNAAAESDLAALSELAAGRERFSSGRYALARESFAAVLRLQGDNLTARLYAALSLFRRNPQDASAYPLVERDLRIVLDSDPAQAEALDTLGLIDMERREWDEAEKCFALLIAADPRAARAADARKKAGLCALYGGRPDKAADYFEAVLRSSPDDAEAAALKAKALASAAD